MAQDETKLLRRVARGDRRAYRELVECYAPSGLALARRVTKDADLAEEALQEAFVDVWRRAARFDPARGQARSWVLAIVHHRAVDAVRREQSATRLGDEAPTPAPADDPEELSVMSDRRMRVLAAVKELSEVQREAIMLAYFEGLTYRQVAERLGVPEGTAKSRLRDGLINLRGSMEAHGVELR